MTDADSFTDLGSVDDFTEAEIAIVTANRREIGVLRWQGRFYAIRNVCPHLGAPLCAGVVGPLLTEDPTKPWQLAADDDRPLVVCPWHRWEFDAATGRAAVGSMRAKTYPVTVRDGRVLIEGRRRLPRDRSAGGGNDGGVGP